MKTFIISWVACAAGILFTVFLSPEQVKTPSKYILIENDSTHTQVDFTEILEKAIREEMKIEKFKDIIRGTGAVLKFEESRVFGYVWYKLEYKNKVWNIGTDTRHKIFSIWE